MSLLTRADSLLWALATTQDTLQAGWPPKPNTIAAAIPVPTGRSDVTVTYLYVAPGTGLHDEVQLADRYAAHFKNQPDVSSYVTGFVPAQIAQLGYLDARLRLFEIRQRAGDRRGSGVGFSFVAGASGRRGRRSGGLPGVLPAAVQPRCSLRFHGPRPAGARTRCLAAGRCHRLLRAVFLSLPG